MMGIFLTISKISATENLFSFFLFFFDVVDPNKPRTLLKKN